MLKGSVGASPEFVAPAAPPRDELIARGIPIVRRIAFRLARRLPPNVDVGDLIGAGTEGLLKAIEGYDPSHTAKFETYAESRIRGAILDELRAQDSMTRHGRRQLSDVSRTIRGLEAKLGRAPEEQEVADALGVSKRTVEQEWTMIRAWLRRELSGEGPS